jgi:hypothetical protein
MSEDQTKITDPLSAPECIAEIRRIAEAFPDKALSRNFFRVHARIAESVWSRHFGTWQEAKRQAGVLLTRHQHRMELDVAKHASVDSFRQMNIDKSGWEDKYLRPNKARFQTMLIGSDIHDKDCDLLWRRTFLDTAKRVQPEKIILNGDVYDAPEFGKYPVDPREWDVVGRIKWVHQFLADLRKVAPNAEITLVAGNHEDRLLRHLAEASPAMRAVLSDLHGFTVSKLLGLEAYEVNFISRNDLATFTVADAKKEVAKNYTISYDAVLCHHFPFGRDMGYPGGNGHDHKHIVWPGYSPAFGPFEWHQLGCGHKRAASYTAGEKWALGFMLAHVDRLSRRTQFEYIDVQDHVVIGGKWYERTQEEFVHLS